LDTRSDIFSFGSVLYEMVTGRRAFHGDSKLFTLSAILKEEPGPAPPEVPRDLERIMARCLRKDPGRRFQHADDLKIALVELKEESDSGKLSPAAVRITGSHGRRVWWQVSLGLVVLVAGLSIWLLFFRTPPAPRAAPTVVPLTSYPGRQGDPALSPDGKQVAFSWDGEKGDNFDIYVKLVGAGAPLRLTSHPAVEWAPAWSPDGRHIAFLRESNGSIEILMIPALGGTERRLGQTMGGSELYNTLAWSPDGESLAFTDHAANEPPGVYLLSVGTGEKRRLTTPPREYSGDSTPRFSPDGKSVAFIRSRSFAINDIYVVPVASGMAGGPPRQVSFSQTFMFGIDWTPDGRNIVFSAVRSAGSALWSIPAAGGKPELLAGVGENGQLPSVSRQGNRLVYQRSVDDPNIWRMPGPSSIERKSQPEKWIASTEADQEPQFSPDGKKIIFASARSGNYELWVCDSNGREPAQITSFNGPPAGSPRWSPDGHWIAFDAPKAGKSDIFVISADGGAPRLLTPGTANNIRPSWSMDGRWIYFGSNRGGGWQIWKGPVQGGAAVQITKGGGYEAFESADGMFTYYARSQSPGIWRVPAEGGEEIQVLDKGGIAIWALARDGICYFDWKDLLHPVMQFYSFSSRRSTVLHEFPRGTNLDANSTAISVSSDGRWILYTQVDQPRSNLVLVENFR